jgi:hypothetical protein
MRVAFLCLAGVLLVSACSKAPTAAQSANAAAPTTAAPTAATPVAAPAFTTGPAVSGRYTGNGKQAVLTQVTAHKDDPLDGKPVTALVFTAKDQGGDDKAATDALIGNFGDAIVARIESDGTVVGADVVHSGLKSPLDPQSPSGSISISGVFKLEDYSAAGGEISGRLTSGGPTDVFEQKVDVDLTFHTKAP